MTVFAAKIARSVASRDAVSVVASSPVVPKRAWVRATCRTASGVPVHEIRPAAAVNVQVNEAGQDKKAGRVNVPAV